MNFLTSCLGASVDNKGDPSKGAKPVKITGLATPRSPPRSAFGRTTLRSSFTDPDKGAKPVRVTSQVSPSYHYSPRSCSPRSISPSHTYQRTTSAPDAGRYKGGLCGNGSPPLNDLRSIDSRSNSLRSRSLGRRSSSPSPKRGSPTRISILNPPKEDIGMVGHPNETCNFGEVNDPFACTHLTELMPVTPIESTYRSHAGGTLPDGIEAPRSSDQNMRRLYVHDEDRVLLKVVHYGNPTSVGIEFEENGEWQFRPLWAQRAGPRAQIYFEPENVKAAIVTCGGLCPGLNDVIRQVVFTLDVYGVKDILGIQYGFKGFVDAKYPPVILTRKSVARVHMAGGSFLGVSRGTPDLNDIVDRLQDWNINFFFVIGGNGSHAGAHAIYLKCLERKLKIAIVGIPKTIDNDLQLVDKTFGFDTSVEEAQRAINAGFIEASSAYNGVAVVKLMGRQSGFIAMYATLASGQVDIVLIPEVPFILEGENGVFNFMKKRLDSNGLCVVVIAEGAGQDLLESCGGVDASGNPILGDIGKWFHSQVKTFFEKIKMVVDVKYIDPTYMIRARSCNSSDHIFCSVLGQNAVHGAFAGYTDMTIGLVNTHYVFLPIPKVIEAARTVDPNSNMWHRTVTATGQPDFPTRPKQYNIKQKAALINPSPMKMRRVSKSPRSRVNTPRSQSPQGDSNQGQQRLSQVSIKIDENNLQIRSFNSYLKQRE